MRSARPCEARGMAAFDPRSPFTVAEARAAGLARWQCEGRRFQRVVTGVYVAADVALTTRALASAALLVAPPGSVLSHHSAARCGQASCRTRRTCISRSPATDASSCEASGRTGSLPCPRPPPATGFRSPHRSAPSSISRGPRARRPCHPRRLTRQRPGHVAGMPGRSGVGASRAWREARPTSGSARAGRCGVADGGPVAPSRPARRPARAGAPACRASWVGVVPARPRVARRPGGSGVRRTPLRGARG